MKEVTGVDHYGKAIDLTAFVDFWDIIEERMGFTLTETKQLGELFKRFDHDEDGLVDKHGLHSAMLWLGFCTPMHVVDELIAGTEATQDGKYDERRFLEVFRKHREFEVREYARVFGSADEDNSGSLDAEELPAIFEDLGYMAASPMVIEECRRDAGIMNKQQLLFEDLYLLMEAFRKKDGFLHEEIKEIEEIFNMFDKDQSSGLSKIQLSGALRWLGHTASVEQILDILHKYDLDDTGDLDVLEFRKLVASYREREILHVRDCFKLHDLDGSGTVTTAELRQTLLHIGFMPGREETEALMDSVGGADVSLNLWDYARLVQRFREGMVKTVRQHHGFTDRELRRLTKKFNRFDPKGTGIISNKNLASLLLDIFPQAKECLDTHAKARQLLEQVDSNKDGTINWMDYLNMMRIIEDRQEEFMLDKEKKAIDASRFTNDEIKEFRTIFALFDSDCSGDLTTKELQDMLSSIVPVNTTTSEELLSLMASCDEDSTRSMDFPEFLRLMRLVLDENWGDILTHTAQLNGHMTAKTAA
jgi:calcium-binding protein CML